MLAAHSDSIEKYFPHGFAGVPPVTGPDGYRHSKAGAFIKSVFRKITPPKILDRLEVHELNLAPYPPAKDSSNGDTHLGISPVRLLYQSLKKVVVHEGKLKKTVHHILKARKSMRFTGTASLGQGMDSSEILKIAKYITAPLSRAYPRRSGPSPGEPGPGKVVRFESVLKSFQI